MKCTYWCAECSIIPNGQRDGVKSCLSPWTPIDFTGVSAKWMQGDKPAIEQENYPLQQNSFTTKMSWGPSRDTKPWEDMYGIAPSR